MREKRGGSSSDRDRHSREPPARPPAGPSGAQHPAAGWEGQRWEARAPGSPVCRDRDSLCWGGWRGPGQRSTLRDQGPFRQAVTGALGPSLSNLVVTRIPRPRPDSRGPSSTSGLQMGLALWGWGRGEVTSGWGNRRIPRGASDPQGRVSEPLKHHATCCRLVCVPLLGAGGDALGVGGHGVSQERPPGTGKHPHPHPSPEIAAHYTHRRIAPGTGLRTHPVLRT